jgi:trimethylamine--corrinoid protein Co-methyltransferase
METKDSCFQVPQFRVLSDGQKERIYEATLQCLHRTGVVVRNAEARALFAGAGAQVDGLCVRIPPHIIEETIASTPPAFALWGRDGQVHIDVAFGQAHFGPGPSCTYYIDPETGERRPVQRGDPAMTALVCDALENIDYVMGLGLIGDVHHRLAPLYEFAEMVTNTVKPVLPWAFSLDNVRDMYQIGLAIAGSEEALRQRPFFALFATFQSPLQHTDEELTNVLWCADHGIPVVYLGGGTAGSSAPITAAGTMVISLAGALSGLAAIQLKRPGAAVCVGCVPEAMDLRTARPAYGGPEMPLYSAALAEVLCHLGLPFMGTAGASEAKVLDLQAAIESTVQVVLSALSGAPLVHDVGFLDCADIGSLEMLVLTDEIIALVRRIMRGIVVDDDTLMLDLIDRVGPGGEFLSTKETAKRCRQEIWLPTLFDRLPWIQWQGAGSSTTIDRIKAKLQAILASHKPAPLPHGASERIAAVLEKAEERVR